MGKIEVKYIPSEEKIEVKRVPVIEQIAETHDQWLFLKYAKMFARHYHDTPEADCMACEALTIIDNGQTEVGLMMSGRSIEQEAF